MKNAMCLFITVLFAAAGTLAAGKCSERNLNAVSRSEEYEICQTVILDAGHGGEDGGAVAPDGTAEKEINLIISNGIASYFELFGIPYIPVRTVDASVCDPRLTTIKERKRSDIINRYALVNESPGRILLSIHQNMFSEAKYSGLQVFYPKHDDASKTLAENIKKSVVPALQPENNREIKPSSNSIFLLYHAKTTSVMVECGFLSNPEELKKLKSESYDAQLSYYIFKGLLNFLTP